MNTNSDILECVNRWARNGIHIAYTTPDHRYSKYYICRYVKYLNQKDSNRDLVVWWHLYAEGWKTSMGWPYHVINGISVGCITFDTFLSAANFAYEFEQKHGRLEELTTI